MRFSSIFRFKRPATNGEEVTRIDVVKPEEPPASAPPARELPEDLDARVRALGEWQVSEL